MRDSKAVKEAKARKPSDGPPSKKQKNAPVETKAKKVQASQQNIVPFDVHDEILLVGEGLFIPTTILLQKVESGTERWN